MSKSYVAARAFNVAGTEKQFAEGDAVTGSRAELANYEAAGLIYDANDKSLIVDNGRVRERSAADQIVEEINEGAGTPPAAPKPRTRKAKRA